MITSEPRRRLTRDERTRLTKKVAAAYRKGATIRDLATTHGRSYGTIHTLLVEAEVVLRARGGRAKKKPTRRR